MSDEKERKTVCMGKENERNDVDMRKVCSEHFIHAVKRARCALAFGRIPEF